MDLKSLVQEDNKNFTQLATLLTIISRCRIYVSQWCKCDLESGINQLCVSKVKRHVSKYFSKSFLNSCKCQFWLKDKQIWSLWLYFYLSPFGLMDGLNRFCGSEVKFTGTCPQTPWMSCMPQCGPSKSAAASVKEIKYVTIYDSLRFLY